MSRAGRLTRGLVATVGGGALGQGLIVISSPVLTRLYGPSDFGALAVFTALVSTVAVVSTLRLEVALLLPDDEREAAALARTGAVASVILSVVIGMVGLVAADRICRALGAPSLAPDWWLVAVTPALIGGFQLLSGRMIRDQRYGALGARNVVQGAATASAQIGLGFVRFGPTGLILGQAIGYAAALCSLTSRRRSIERERLAFGNMRATLVRYRRFPLISSWSALINTAGLQVPLLVVSAVYGQVVVGLLGLTLRVLAAPLALVGRNVAQVFVGEASAGRRVGTGELADQVRRTVLWLLAIGALPALAVMALGPALFSTIFGARWNEAGVYAQILSAGTLAQFAVSPVSQTLLVLERQTAQVAWDAGRLVLTIAAPLFCAVLGAPAQTAVASLSAALVVSYAALFVVCRRAASRAEVHV